MDLESTDNGTDRILWCWLGLKSVELEPVGGLDSASVTAPTTGEYANVTERGDLDSGFAPAWGVHHCPSLQASRGGFQLRLKRTSVRYDRARRPLDRVSEGVLGGTLQATHCGSAQSRSRTNIQKDQPTTPAGTTPPSSPTPDTQRLHLPNSTEGSPTLTQLRLSNDKATDSPRQQELLSWLEDAECARHRPLGLLSLELGLDSTPQVYAYTNGG
ncbi:hypothetical protein THAOC_31960 [Thalassiosira oceanica]|uniref:Uncharacterized protein n=1 Tax=Thalassiosira oceanica TaxID=159749 RepID=K0RRG0_THAOC|nr:hypothetical protein THAOC_31960 [Thalassiosira oceanica]|eukprot:EJK49192.1 hypothetical protein THAOC_31960 [Thalassiosira oceanica]